MSSKSNNRNPQKRSNWRKYAWEFLSIFVAVVSAFALSNWNDNRNNAQSEQKILTEIKNGIKLDQHDFESNIKGHQLSLRANQAFRELLAGTPVAQDSVELYYTLLFRDYKPIINRSGYESLKEAGLKTITDDSLRLQIISLYDYYYGIIEVIDNVNEMQSFEHYFANTNDFLHPYMEFSATGKLANIAPPQSLSAEQRKKILSYLWRLDNNRKFKLRRYNSILQEMESTQAAIAQMLNS